MQVLQPQEATCLDFLLGFTCNSMFMVTMCTAFCVTKANDQARGMLNTPIFPIGHMLLPNPNLRFKIINL